MKKLVRIFYNDEFIAVAFLEGIKFVKGEYGWFTCLELLTLTGEKIDGWGYCVYPFTPLLCYMEPKNEEESN